MLSLRTSPVVALARACTSIGGGLIGGLLRGLVVAVLVYRRRWLQLAAFALTLVTTEFVVTAWKELSARPRPASGLVATASWAFPSGHAALGATALGVVFVLVPPGPKRRKWALAALVFAAAMALSRTYLGVHWLSDIVAGTLLGLAAAVGWPALVDLVAERRFSRRTRGNSRTGS